MKNKKVKANGILLLERKKKTSTTTELKQRPLSLDDV
jgi:hypothetical protein